MSDNDMEASLERTQGLLSFSLALDGAQSANLGNSTANFFVSLITNQNHDLIQECRSQFEADYEFKSITAEIVNERDEEFYQSNIAMGRISRVSDDDGEAAAQNENLSSMATNVPSEDENLSSMATNVPSEDENLSSMATNVPSEDEDRASEITDETFTKCSSVLTNGDACLSQKTSDMRKKDQATVRITNLPDENDEEHVRNLFVSFDHSIRIFFRNNQANNDTSKGSTLVSFEDKDIAKKAIECFSGIRFHDRILQVEWANEAEKNE